MTWSAIGSPLTGNRFQIQSEDGKPLYAGTVRVDPSAQPAAIDFEHTEGASNGEGVAGNLCPGRRHADGVRQRPEPGQGPAHRVRGNEWVWVCPHHVQAREALNGNSLGWPAGGPAPPQAAQVAPNKAVERTGHTTGFFHMRRMSVACGPPLTAGVRRLTVQAPLEY